MKIHHIGYLVRHLDKAAEVFAGLGYVPQGTKTVDKGRNLEILFMTKDGVNLELVSPLSRESAVGNLLKKQGPSPYHICYETDTFEQDTVSLEQNGYLRITEPEAAPAIGGKKVVFLLHPQTGLLELSEA